MDIILFLDKSKTSNVDLKSMSDGALVSWLIEISSFSSVSRSLNALSWILKMLFSDSRKLCKNNKKTIKSIWNIFHDCLYLSVIDAQTHVHA